MDVRSETVRTVHYLVHHFVLPHFVVSNAEETQEVVKLQTRKTVIHQAAKPKMFKSIVISSLSLLLTSVLTLSAAAQANSPIPYKSSEVSENDGLPVLIKHLPDWESVRGQAKFSTNVGDLKAVLGERPVLDLIDFSIGTEAVTASYPAGKLLIVEFATPQASIESDADFTAKLAESRDSSTVYRRIGNYNAFVFDAPDPAAANALLDQVKYEKQIQWLGKNPFLISAERAFVLQTSDLFLSTVVVILIGIGFSIVGGLLAGFMFFRSRERRRAAMPTFTDAGGMTRLNLDGFTPEISPDRLLR